MKEYIIQVDDNFAWDGSQKVLETRELVRCKDCKWLKPISGMKMGWCTRAFSLKQPLTEEWFCAEGEREEKEPDDNAWIEDRINDWTVEMKCPKCGFRYSQHGYQDGTVDEPFPYCPKCGKQLDKTRKRPAKGAGNE